MKHDEVKYNREEDDNEKWRYEAKGYGDMTIGSNKIHWKKRAD